LPRRLAAILAADVVGYSRLMGADEAGTLERLKSLRKELVQPRIIARSGRIVKLMGDGLLAEFPSVVEAVQCAVEIQEGVAERDPDLPRDRRIWLRIGVNLGDIIVEGNDIYGDGVNVAARLESLAEPRGICLSGDAYRQVRGKLDVRFEDLGERRVKNIAEPLRVYRLIVGSQQGDRKEPPFEARIGLDFSIPDYPSIAVLPFTVMGNDPEQEFFADGVAEDIITALSKISRLLVVARNSSFTYKGKAVDVKQVSREQGVRYVLEGSVRKAGNRVRVTAQLVDATTGLHLWAERYDRELEDIFAVQDEITREIVVAMDVQLREGEQHRVWSRGTRILEAWESVRLASDDVLGGSADKQPRAKELVERALALDPDYAIAWAMRGWLYFTEADVGGGIGTKEQFDQAQAAAFRCGRRALQADPDCAEAYGVLALTHLNAGEHDAAIAMTEKAIALAPNSPEILGGVASAVMRKSGRPDRGAECVKKAMRLSPFYRPGLLRALGNNYRLSGRLEVAVACYRESLKRETGYLAAYVNLASALGELGWLDEAREAAREVLHQDPDFSISGYAKGLSYRNPSDLQRIVDGLRQAGLPVGDDGPSPHADGRELPNKPSIAVLPFENMSGDPEQEYFSDGITEDVITELSRFSSLFVIARNSSFAYKGQSVDVRRVAQELGVRFVLEGSIRRAGKRVRITTQLIDSETGNHLWAERYDRDLEDIFDLQDEITRDVVGSIAPQIELAEVNRARRAKSSEVSSYDLSLKAQALFYDAMRMGRPEVHQQAIDAAGEALEHDSRNAHALWIQSVAYYEQHLYRWGPAPDEALDHAWTAVERLFEIDSSDPRAYSSRGAIHLFRGKHDAAVADFRRSFELNPNSAVNLFLMAWCESLSGFTEEARRHAELGLRLSPRELDLWLGVAYLAYAQASFADSDFEMCKEWGTLAIQMHPRAPIRRTLMIACCGYRGELEEAREHMDYLESFSPDFLPSVLQGGLSLYKMPEHNALLVEGLRKAGLTQ